MIASICKEVGAAGLVGCGFYAATLTSLIAPPVGLAMLGAAALWLYGRSKD